MDWMYRTLEILCLTAIIEGILALIWKIICHFFQYSWDTGMMYVLLKWLLAGCLLPLLLLHPWWDEMLCWKRERMHHAVLYDQLIFVLWTGGMFFSAVSLILQWLQLKQILRITLPPCKEEAAAMENLKKRLGISRNIRLCKSYGMMSPCIYGFFRPTIVLPVRTFSSDQLEMILFHELLHYKHGDLDWRMLAILWHCIYWFLPYAGFWEKEMNGWSEACCDEQCCRCYPAHDYFSMMNSLLADAQELTEQEGFSAAERVGSFPWRVLHGTVNSKNRV